MLQTSKKYVFKIKANFWIYIYTHNKGFACIKEIEMGFENKSFEIRDKTL
jgi:hypothetical protein